jgi:hypothetical protein
VRKFFLLATRIVLISQSNLRLNEISPAGGCVHIQQAGVHQAACSKFAKRPLGLSQPQQIPADTVMRQVKGPGRTGPFLQCQRLPGSRQGRGVIVLQLSVKLVLETGIHACQVKVVSRHAELDLPRRRPVQVFPIFHSRVLRPAPVHHRLQERQNAIEPH